MRHSDETIELLVTLQAALAPRALTEAMLAARASGAQGTTRKTLERLVRACGIGVNPAALKAARSVVATGAFPLTVLDPFYPAAFLSHLGAGAPSILFCLGNRALLAADGVAIVGMRRPTADGRNAARSYACALSRAGAPVVSGNARGIDAEAHEAALDCGGSTIVFPPAAIDQFEPSFAEPADWARWLVLSPFRLGEKDLRWQFLRRNELVAAFSMGAIVAETGTRGGTLNTVGHLRRLGRPWFVVRHAPGAEHFDAHRALLGTGGRPLPPSATSRGVARLLTTCRDGATLLPPDADNPTDLFGIPAHG